MPTYVDDHSALLGLDTQRWNYPGAAGTPVAITYSFLAAVPDYYGPDAPERADFSAFTAAQRQVARSALRQIEECADVTFTPVSGAGQITFGNCAMYWGGYAWLPDPYWSVGGDIWINKDYKDWPTAPGTWHFGAIVHEIGHAMGLEHPHDGSDPQLDPSLDSPTYSVMTYAGSPYDGIGPFTYMLFDIQALQALYGVNWSTRAGNDTYGFNSSLAGRPEFSWTASSRPVCTIWDGGGIDTLDASGFSGPSAIDLNEGQFSSVNGLTRNVGIAHGARIENARGGAGNDTLQGNALANMLWGGAGNDVLLGGLSKDRMIGGPGNDRLDGGAGLDTADYAGARLGIAVRLSTGTATGAASDVGADTLLGIEAVLGGSGNDALTGNSAANLLVGGAGADTLDGGKNNDTLRGGTGYDALFGALGDDWLAGGAGSDRLAGGAGGDRFVLAAAGESGATAGTRDVITDFQVGIDRIDLSALDAKPAVAGNQAFGFIGAGALTAAGQVRFVRDAANDRTIVEGSIDADGAAEFRIELVGLHTLTAGDFVL